ncbi:hypothetical protein SK128_019536 [Halocaridina rubra]|uniref:Uncharacterized protein n=1 Tax=Halocaridina rubra TaxID=373956 RepID=A0AAN8WY01_HALRR
MSTTAVQVFTTLLILLMTASAETEPKAVGEVPFSKYYRRPQYYRGSFNPLLAKIGPMEETEEFDLKIKFQVHSVAFGVRALRRLLDPIFRKLEHNSVTLEERFPVRIMPEEPNIGFFCETGFTDCVDYLSKDYANYNLTVQDDKPTSIIASRLGLCKPENKYTFCNIEKMKEDTELKQEWLTKNITEDHPLIVVRHYKRLLTAMQFMCWYTMHKIYFLKFILQCDTTSYVTIDKDPRANSRKPFACAVYSFCPNPCEYEGRLSNPCKGEFQPEKTMRVFCQCEKGYKFDPSDGEDGACLENFIFGIGHHSCDSTSQDPIYYPDATVCECKGGYAWDEFRKLCVVDADFLEYTPVEIQPPWHQRAVDNVSQWFRTNFKALAEYYETIVPRLLKTSFVAFYTVE